MLLSLSNAFIKRPVLSTVCTIVIILLGTISMAVLPLDKLPEIAPKKVAVTANYIGADAKTTEDNVTTVLEREINGTEQVRWIDSFTDNTGNVSINVTFPTEMDRNTAQVLVQNRVSQAQSTLPSVVNQAGVRTNTQSPSLTLVYGFYAENGPDGQPLYDKTFIYNYVDRYVWNEMKGLPGVGSVGLFGGANYAMRIWLDPDKLAARGLTALDVVGVINEQNFDVGVGRIGQQPAPPEQQFELPLRVQGRFQTVAEAEDMVVKVGNDGTLIRIGDVGYAELGMENYDTVVNVDGFTGVAFLIYQLPGSNALETADAAKAKMAELEPNFPPGLKVVIGLDNTLFVNASLNDLSITLLQAIALVVLVIFVFLQDWRTTIIPGIAIPVALVGAMIGLNAFGFTLNQLSLFACVLATGLVVDDGIVIVEAVSSKLAQGMRPTQAAMDAMDELFGATISTSVVLMAVFIPVCFFPGTTGIVYRQFALTIIFAVLFSTFNALTFSPTMSAILLGPPEEKHGPLAVFFRWFNQGFDVIREAYRGFINFLTRIRIIIMALFIGGLVATGWIYTTMPSGFIPAEDQGYFFALVDAPPGVSLNYTQAIDRQVTDIIQNMDNAEQTLDHVINLTGFSFEGRNANKSLTFVKLKPWEERPGPKKSAFGIIQNLNRQFAQNISGARVFATNAPPVDGLSNFDGSEIFIQDRQLKGMDALIDNVQRVITAANQRPEIGQTFTTFTFNSPLMSLSIDREKAKAQNVDIDSILRTLQTYIGSNFVNQFVFEGRLYRVYAQATAQDRSNPQDIGRLYVRSREGAMVQLSNLVSTETTTYPPILTRYKTFPAIKLIASPAQGYSSGQVIQAMEAVAQETLQPGFGYSWTNTAAEEQSSAGAAPIVFGLAFVMVFLVLAAQYESYIDPTIILLTVPLAILGALGMIWLRVTFVQTAPFNPGNGIWPVLNNNMYAQVALVMLIGLAAKNAILIVEFANQSRDLGMSITQAAISASEQRLRPILMTAVSSLVGFAPLLAASSVGAVSRWSLGTAIFGGLALATVLSLVLVPILYIVIKNFEKYVLGGDDGTPPGDGGNGHGNGNQPSPTAPEEEQTPVYRISSQGE
ncbi:RND multidrug efflux transporter [Crocosphaera subtropica ATCC 51142]|uniref:RND multidrug efflux transporter n=1 Tax=Crocosphaera subtropica (strain ATCC 51142 / BH68) TaxID=43989 RepID=B1WSA6_CROS5|nr:efflux RND transporter permease subunit [Crocosphaera subtropica]ACB51892.1 RND multidrug efflux transporter [Crocosphaera subtropica ATCC 51142]